VRAEAEEAQAALAALRVDADAARDAAAQAAAAAAAQLSARDAEVDALRAAHRSELETARASLAAEQQRAQVVRDGVADEDAAVGEGGDRGAYSARGRGGRLVPAGTHGKMCGQRHPSEVASQNYLLIYSQDLVIEHFLIFVAEGILISYFKNSHCLASYFHTPSWLIKFYHLLKPF
jgi:hypothetical protein